MEQSTQDQSQSRVRGVLKKVRRTLLVLVVLFFVWVILANTLGKWYLGYVERQKEAYYKKEHDRFIEVQKNDTYGGTTPEETLDMFLAALKKGDAELASKYYLIEKQEKKLKELQDELQKYGNLDLSVKYFSDVKTGKKTCHDLDNAGAGCNFDYTYITIEDKTSEVVGTDYKLFVPKGSERSKFIDLRPNSHTKVWKIVQP